MEYPCVLFRTPDERQISNLKDLTRLTTSQLETILRQSHTAVGLLEAELERRSVTAPTASRSALRFTSRLEGFYVKLRETAKLIRDRRRLTSRLEENIQKCLQILNGAKGDYWSKRYKHFSNDLLSSCSPFARGLLLLCAASFGKHNIAVLSQGDVTKLLDHIRDNMNSLHSPALELLTASYDVPHPQRFQDTKAFTNNAQDNDPQLARATQYQEDNAILGDLPPADDIRRSEPISTSQDGQFSRPAIDIDQNALDNLNIQTQPQSAINDVQAQNSKTHSSDPSVVGSQTGSHDQLHYFRRLLHESDEALALLKILCFLDRSGIPEIMLLRAGLPQKVWNCSGEIDEMTPREAGLDNDLLPILSDTAILDKAIKLLETSKLITSKPIRFGARLLTVNKTAILHMSQCVHEPNKWRLQALLLVCHTFPMHSYIEPLYGDLGRCQITQVQHVLQYYSLLEEKAFLSGGVKRKMVATLLAASYFSDVYWKLQALEVAKKIAEEESDSHLKTRVRLREHAVLRLRGVVTEPERNLTENNPVDAMSWALLGESILSSAATLIQCNKLHLALSLLQNIKIRTGTRPSRIEQYVLYKKSITIARICCFQAKFSEAEKRLRLTPDDHELYSVTTCDHTSLLAQVLCELGRPQEAQMLLRTVIGNMHSRGWQDLSRVKRLRLSSAETFLQQGLILEAQNQYSSFKTEKGDNSSQTLVARMSKLRFWVGLARISHLNHLWSDALCYWEQALVAATECEWEEGFIEMVIHYSTSHVKFELRKLTEAMDHAKKADELYSRKGRQYLFIGLGTYWLDFILSALNTKYRIHQKHEAKELMVG